MKLNNNDDSHNSGLNLLIYNMLLDIESHPAWVCGLAGCRGCIGHVCGRGQYDPGWCGPDAGTESPDAHSDQHG